MISRDDITKLAHLARIHITSKEEEMFQHDLERVLSYMANLEEADTKDVEPLKSVGGLHNAMRSDADDVRVDSVPPERLVEAAPSHEGRHVKVRSVWK